MMFITANTQVGDIVVEAPAAIPFFEKLGIDYCCGGKHTLVEACAKDDRDVSAVIEELQCQLQNGTTSGIDWQNASLKDLIDHIVQKHHTFTRSHLTLIGELATKVERRHGLTHPEIYKVCELLEAMTAELTHHLSCEEEMLFPYIDQLDGSRQAVGHITSVGMQVPVARLIMDHNQTGDEFRALREATNNYRLPDDACTTYRALYRAIEELERDLHQHIHLENNILFPRALELEVGVPNGVTNVAAAHR